MPRFEELHLAGRVLIARLSAFPAAVADGLTTSDARSAIARFLVAARQVRRATTNASDELYVAIGAEADPSVRSALLRIRRDLFNGRFPRQADSTLIQASRPGLSAVIATAILALETREASMKRINAAYDETQRVARMAIRDLLKDPRLAHGILLSSPTLYRNLRRYASAIGNKLSARDVQIERGVLRYLTRASAKATPFAAFCNIVAGSIIEESEQRATAADPHMIGSLEERRSVVRLNKALYGRLWAAAKTTPTIREHLIVELNPTLADRDGVLVFLAALQGREVFQRLEPNDALDLVRELAHQDGGRPYSSFVSALARDERVEATSDEAARFVDELIRLGLLRFRAPVRAAEAGWAEPFSALLRTIEGEAAGDIKRLLDEAARVATAYTGGNATTRAELSDHLRQHIKAALGRLKLDPGRESELPLYEDCGSSLHVCLGTTDSAQLALRSLRAFTERFLPIAHPRSEMAAMRHFFDSFYADDAQCVPLLTFYEDYYREHFRSHIEKQQRLSRGERDAELRSYDVRNPFRLEAVDRILDAGRGWTAVIRARWAANLEAEEIHIGVGDVPNFDVPPLNPRVPRSVALFCNFVPPTSPDGKARFVTNAGRTYLGFGKYFSRFLHVVSEDTNALVCHENEEHRSEYVLAEIGGDANFNGNLHPQIVEATIQYPTGDSDTDTNIVRCGDLAVRRDERDPLALTIQHTPSGKCVIPLDLGFLGLMHRPPLYQLLARFAPFGSDAIQLPPTAESPEASAATPRITYRPRIVFDRCVVLARRCWRVPAVLFPRRVSGERDVDYFIRLQQWREVHGIPMTVYVRVLRPPHVGTAVTKKDDAPNERDESPFDVSNLTTAKTPTSIEAQERLDELAFGDEGDSVGDEESMARANNEESTPEADQGRAHTVGLKSTYHRRVERPSRDLLKPQFIDFSSPVLVDLFHRLPGDLASFTVIVEERYPPFEALPVIEGEAYNCELILQFAWPGLA